MEDRTANLLGALIIALGDSLRSATEATAGHGGAAPAALTTASQFEEETVGSLGAWLGLSQPAGVRLVDRLAADGLVERVPGRDGRTVKIKVNDAGRELATRVLEARERVLADALEALTQDEQATLSNLLEKILAQVTVDVPHARLICRLCEISACPQDRCPVTLAARGQFHSEE